MSETEKIEGQKAVRREMIDELERDLIGPSETDEMLAEPPLDFYMAGILYPTIADDGPAPR